MTTNRCCACEASETKNPPPPQPGRRALEGFKVIGMACTGVRSLVWLGHQIKDYLIG